MTQEKDDVEDALVECVGGPEQCAHITVTSPKPFECPHLLDHERCLAQTRDRAS